MLKSKSRACQSGFNSQGSSVVEHTLHKRGVESSILSPGTDHKNSFSHFSQLYELSIGVGVICDVTDKVGKMTVISSSLPKLSLSLACCSIKFLPCTLTSSFSKLSLFSFS